MMFYNIYAKSAIVLIGGNFNTEFTRNRSVNRQALVTFMAEENMQCCLTSSCINIDYTYESKCSGTTSLIDHFIVTDNVFPLISNYKCIHSGDNLSAHSPVSLTLDIDVQHTCPRTSICESKMLWHKAMPRQIQEYKTLLDTYLHSVHIPHDALYCTDMLCHGHTGDIEQFHEDIK